MEYKWKFLIPVFVHSGARETDYPAGEEVDPKTEAALAGNGEFQSTNSSSSAGGDCMLEGITVVGCEAEGVGPVSQTAVTPGKDMEAGQWY